MSNVNVKDARDVFLRCKTVLEQRSEHFRLVNRAAVKWNPNNQWTMMSRFTSCQLQLLSQPLYFQRLANAGTMRLYHSHTASNTHTDRYAASDKQQIITTNLLSVILTYVWTNAKVFSLQHLFTSSFFKCEGHSR